MRASMTRDESLYGSPSSWSAGAKKGRRNHSLLPFCLLPFAFCLLPSRRVDLCLRDDFDEHGPLRQFIQPLLEARAQLLAREQPRVAVRRDDLHRRRRWHASQGALDQLYVLPREPLRHAPLRECRRERARASGRILVCVSARERVERDGEVRAEPQERSAVDREAALHQSLKLLRQLLKLRGLRQTETARARGLAVEHLPHLHVAATAVGKTQQRFGLTPHLRAYDRQSRERLELAPALAASQGL